MNVPASGMFYPEFAEAFAGLLASLQGRKVAIVGHARPDGDCIGSQVALARALATRGIDAICVNPDPVPRRLRFLTEGMTFVRTDEVLAGANDRAAIFVDCADRARGGERLGAWYSEPVAAIDHHLSNVGFAAINLIDSRSAATCEMLAGMLLDQGMTIDAQSAQALYTGILTDTGQFRFQSTSRRCFLLAGELVARGANPTEAGYELYERESVGRMKLLQRFLSSLRMECGGRLCLGVLPAGIFEETGSTVEDTEGLVDYARCIEGVDIGVLVEMRADGSVKASLRAKEPVYRVDRAAAQFGGGGHACAAGLNLKRDTENFTERLIAALAERIRAVDAGEGSKSC